MYHFRPICGILCSDGKARDIVFPLAVHCGDQPEQCDIIGLMKNTQCSRPCNDCMVGKGHLFDALPGRPRTEAELTAVRDQVWAILRHGAPGAKKAAADLLGKHSMRYMNIQVYTHIYLYIRIYTVGCLWGAWGMPVPYIYAYIRIYPCICVYIPAFLFHSRFGRSIPSSTLSPASRPTGCTRRTKDSSKR
jgi:hypothetical protein